MESKIRTLAYTDAAARLALAADLGRSQQERKARIVESNVRAVQAAYNPPRGRFIREQKRNARLNFAKQREKEKIAKAHASEGSWGANLVCDSPHTAAMLAPENEMRVLTIDTSRAGECGPITAFD